MVDEDADILALKSDLCEVAPQDTPSSLSRRPVTTVIYAGSMSFLGGRSLDVGTATMIHASGAMLLSQAELWTAL